ncbi:hypothetical protein PR202_gb09600 [Eleusine coracana subsp. coracana]|uniref:Aldehyde dehydrogenase domain-containing protein n=1 Tax=Eleusine coracana subsp. coracana TaxID=191504 RepID=A0AAV5EHS6_ELECO|nr:hypothetical protein PR202_gb09600 [Eleusine coracana subsp. coracana]
MDGGATAASPHSAPPPTYSKFAGWADKIHGLVVPSAALCSHMDVDKLAFTGSTCTSKIILELPARSSLKPVASPRSSSWTTPTSTMPSSSRTMPSSSTSSWRSTRLAFRKGVEQGPQVTTRANATPYGLAAVPFGGFKLSGVGREKGPYGLRNYLQTKSVVTPIRDAAWL